MPTNYTITPNTLELTFQAVSPDFVAQNLSVDSPLLKAIGPDKFEDCEYLIYLHPSIYREQRLTHEMSPQAADRYRLFLRAIDSTLCELRTLLIDLFLLIQPYEAPYPILPFLSPIVGVDFNYDVPDDAARKEVANAIFLWERKGSRDNLSDWIGFITGFTSKTREYYKEVLRTNVYNQAYAVTPSTINNHGGPNYATLPHLSETHLTNTWAGDEKSLPFYNFYAETNDNYGIHGYTQLAGEVSGYFHIATHSEGWDDFEPLPGTERRVESVGVGELAPGFLFRNHVGLFLDVPDEQLEQTWFGEPIFNLFLDKLRRILDLTCFYGVVKHIIWRLITEDDAGLCEDISFTVIPRFAEGWGDTEPLGSSFTQTEHINCNNVTEDAADCIGETYSLYVSDPCFPHLANFVCCTNEIEKITNDSTLDSNGGPWLTWFYATYWDEQAGRYPTTIPTMGTPGAKADGDILQTWTPTFGSTFTSEIIITPDQTVGEEFVSPLIGLSQGQGAETTESISQYVLDVCATGVFEDNILNGIEEWNNPFQDTTILADDWDIPQVFEDTEIFTDNWDSPETEDTEVFTDDWDIEVSFSDMLEATDSWNISDIFSDNKELFDDWEVTVPLTLTGPGVWLDGNNGPMGNSPINIWLDRFTNPGNNDAVQPTVDNRPDHDQSDADFNDFGAVTFDGTNDYMYISDDISLSGDRFTAFVVMEWNSQGFNDAIVTKSSSESFTDGWGIVSRGSNTTRFFVDDIGSNFVDATIQDGTPVILCVEYDQTSLEFIVNGQTIGSYSYGAGINNSSKDLVIGAYNLSGSGFGGFFNGTLAEFIYYNRDLSLSEKVTIITYLSNKYNITVDFSTEIVAEDWDISTSYSENSEIDEPFDFDTIFVETPEVDEEFEFVQIYNEAIVADDDWEQVNIPDSPNLLVDEDWDVSIPSTPSLVAFEDFDGDIEYVAESWNLNTTYDETSEVSETFDFTVVYDEQSEVPELFDFDQSYLNSVVVFEIWSDNDVLEFGPETWTPGIYIVDSTSFQFTEIWEPTTFLIDSSSFQFFEDWSPTVFTTDSSSFSFYENWDAAYLGIIEFGVETWDVPYTSVSEFFENWTPGTYIVDSTSFQFFEDWES